jgi:hypothetical protein
MSFRCSRFVLEFFYGLIAVLLVSGLSLVGLLALPILYKVSFEYMLSLFTAIAVGTLFGDAIFHLVPAVRDSIIETCLQTKRIVHARCSESIITVTAIMTTITDCSPSLITSGKCS